MSYKAYLLLESLYLLWVYIIILAHKSHWRYKFIGSGKSERISIASLVLLATSFWHLSPHPSLEACDWLACQINWLPRHLGPTCQRQVSPGVDAVWQPATWSDLWQRSAADWKWKVVCGVRCTKWKWTARWQIYGHPF